MRTVLIASLRTHTRRYVAAFIAVMIAVGFIVVTNALASATKAGLSSGVDDVYRQGDLVVGESFGISDADLKKTLDVARRQDDRVSVVGATYAPVASDSGQIGTEVSVGTVSTDARMRWQGLQSGRAPRTDHEGLMDADAAKSAGVGIGDSVTIGSGADRVHLKVVGLAKSSSYLGSDVYAPWSALSQLPTAQPDAVVYDVTRGDVGERAQQLRDAVSDADVRSRADYVDDRVQQVNQGVDAVSYMLLLFAGIAGFVAVLVIANTFTILFAQRSRDFALLRCVGATRRQVLRSVRVESVALAFIASALGLLGGTVAGYGIVALVRAFAGADTIGAISLSPTWMISAFVGGVLTTVVAAWWPTRSVVRVSPLAALRPEQPASVRTRAGQVRIALGVLLAAAGAALLTGAVVSSSMPLLMAGGMTSFLGVLLLGPVIVPALLRIVGSAAGRLGPSARIAAANAVRNPRRSAATTASLLVGVTLTTAVLTGMASGHSAIDKQLDEEHPVDVAVSGTATIDAKTTDRVQGVRDIEQVHQVHGVVATTKGLGKVAVLAPTDAARGATRDPNATAAKPGEVLVPQEVLSSYDGRLPNRLTLEVDGHRTTVKTRLVGSEWGRTLVADAATVRSLGGTSHTLALWAEAAPNADPDALNGDVGAAVRGTDLDVTNAAKDRAWVQLQLDVLAWSVLGLLGVGIAIALVGIANTVGLSVLERGREHALLRALGLTRRQLRRVLASEGVLLALVAGVLGTLLGTTYGWLGVVAVIHPLVSDAPLVVPWVQLAGVVLAAALAGLVACVLPARRAAKVQPAEGLTLD